MIIWPDLVDHIRGLLQVRRSYHGQLMTIELLEENRVLRREAVITYRKSGGCSCLYKIRNSQQ